MGPLGRTLGFHREEYYVNGRLLEVGSPALIGKLPMVQLIIGQCIKLYACLKKSLHNSNDSFLVWKFDNNMHSYKSSSRLFWRFGSSPPYMEKLTQGRRG